jgi:2-methylisocitrate lyase-like PEP mutase family enzyme
MLTPVQFHALHRPGDPLVLPNAWDLASARWLHASGFTVVGTTSLGVAAAAGLPDGAGETADETFDLARRITVAGIPVTVDLEAGFSDDPDLVGRFAARLADLGVVGVNVEDSDATGRLVDPDVAARKVAAIASAAPELYLNARTDPFWIGGTADLASRTREAVARAHRYLEAGASGVFVPGVIPLDVMASLTRAIAAPVNVLVQPGVTVAELATAGVARVSTGSLLFRVALGAIEAAARGIRDGGETPAPRIPSYEEVAGLP